MIEKVEVGAALRTRVDESAAAGCGASSRSEDVTLMGIAQVCETIGKTQAFRSYVAGSFRVVSMRRSIAAVAVLAVVPPVAVAAGKKTPQTPPKPLNVQQAPALDGGRSVRLTCDFGGQSFPRSVADRVVLYRNGKKLDYTAAMSSRRYTWQECQAIDAHPPGGTATYEVAMVGNAQAWYPENPPIVKSDPITVETVGPPPGTCSVMLSFGTKSQVRRSLQKRGKAPVSVLGSECVGKVTNVAFTWEQNGKAHELGSLPVTLGDYYEKVPAVLNVNRKQFADTAGGNLSVSASLEGVTVKRSLSFTR